MGKVTSWHTTRYAYHEAGHALLGHLYGRCIAEVVIVREKGSHVKGYCLFDTYAELCHGLKQWKDDTYNLEKIIMLSGGSVAFLNLCEERGWNFEKWNKSAGQDAKDIDDILRHMASNEEERRQFYKQAIDVATNLIMAYWPTLEELASHLIEHGAIEGSQAHALMHQSLAQTHQDWRTNRDEWYTGSEQINWAED